mgnify:CR=1 FL=1
MPDSAGQEFTERRGPGRATDQRGRRLRHAEMLLDVHARYVDNGLAEWWLPGD